MIPDDLRALLKERRQADRRRRSRPTLDDLDQDGPPLSPAAFGALVGMSREYVRLCCYTGSIEAKRVQRGQAWYWEITRASARYWVKTLLSDRKPAA